MYFTKKERVVIIIVVCFIAVLSFFKIFNPDNKKADIAGDEILEKTDIDLLENAERNEEEVSTAEISKIVIHIAGSVKNPGILELENGKRVIDAIDLSGGLMDEADISSINLARKLSDEEKIYIPKLGEIVEEKREGIDTGLGKVSASDIININICSKEELMTLPGIGDKTADKILNYREENIFKNIEDIKKVSGIGEKKFEAIKDLIKVNWGVKLWLKKI